MSKEIDTLQAQVSEIKSIELGQLYMTMPEARRYPLETEIIRRDCPICGSELAIERYKRPMMMRWETAVKTYPNLPKEKNLYCPVCGSLLRWTVNQQGYYEGYIKGLEAMAITAKPWRVPYNVKWHSVSCPECGESFQYATMLGKHGIELRCPKCQHNFGRKEGYFGAIRKAEEVKEPLEARPVWTKVECPECGSSFEYRSFHYPYGVSLVCPVCGHNFGVKAGYMGEEWDIRNVVKGEREIKKVEEKPPAEVKEQVPEKVNKEVPKEKINLPIILGLSFGIPVAIGTIFSVVKKIKKGKKKYGKPKKEMFPKHWTGPLSRF